LDEFHFIRGTKLLANSDRALCEQEKTVARFTLAQNHCSSRGTLVGGTLGEERDGGIIEAREDGRLSETRNLVRH
jgi:hypothetical protein